MTREVERDASGKFVSAKLSSDEARKMSQARWDKHGSGRTDALLNDRGVDPQNVDEGLRSLAEIATSGRSGAVAAQKYLDAITGFFRQDKQTTYKAQPGEMCNSCGQYVMPGKSIFTQGFVDKVIDRLQKDKGYTRGEALQSLGILDKDAPK